MTIVPVVLAGGRGERLWPMSREARPKPVLPLVGDAPLLRTTCDRVAPLAGDGRVRVIGVEGMDEALRASVPQVGPEDLWLEPLGRNTGPSIAWVLAELADQPADAVLAVFPADHTILDEDGLRAAVRRAADAALDAGRIALLGIRPDRAETGFGWIEMGEPLAHGLSSVARFLEKPSAEAAAGLLNRGGMLWNSGIFVMPIAAGRRLVAAVSPPLGEFMRALPQAGTARRPGKGDRERLTTAFAAVEPVPFDIAVMERTEARAVLPVDIGWNDLGTWEAVWEARTRDAAGNSISTGSLALEATDCLIEGEDVRVAAFGVRDLIIVAAGGAVLVCPRDRAAEVRRVASLWDANGGRNG